MLAMIVGFQNWMLKKSFQDLFNRCARQSPRMSLRESITGAIDSRAMRPVLRHQGGFQHPASAAWRDKRRSFAMMPQTGHSAPCCKASADAV
ncbi:MAG: hypothetical protein WBV39_03965 [Rudaea sp.]